MSWLLRFLRCTHNFYSLWNPVRTINLRLNFTWFKKFQISAQLGNRNAWQWPKRSLRNLKEFGSKRHATLVKLLCKNVLKSNRPRWLYWTWLNLTAVVILVLQPLWEPFQGVTAESLCRPAPDKIRWKTYLKLKVVSWQVLGITWRVTRLICLATL